MDVIFDLSIALEINAEYISRNSKITAILI